MLLTERDDGDEIGDKDGGIAHRLVTAFSDEVQCPADRNEHKEYIATRRSAGYHSSMRRCLLTHSQLDSAAALKLLRNVGDLPIFLSGVKRPVVIRLTMTGSDSLRLVRLESPEPSRAGLCDMGPSSSAAASSSVTRRRGWRSCGSGPGPGGTGWTFGVVAVGELFILVNDINVERLCSSVLGSSLRYTRVVSSNGRTRSRIAVRAVGE